MATLGARLEENSIRDDDLKSSAYTSFSVKESLDHKNLHVDGDKPGTPYQQGAWQGAAHSKCCKCVDTFVTVVIVILVWAMMALPTIIYLAAGVKPSSTQKAHAPGSDNATCTLYDGSDSDYCTAHLQHYTNCLRDFTSLETDKVLAVSPSKSRISEMNVIQDALTRYARPQCLRSAEPVLCLLFIHLCDNGTDIGPSKKQCDRVSEVCDKELEELAIVNRYTRQIIDKYLSQCTTSESPLDNTICAIGTKNMSNQTLNCSDGFFYDENKEKCLPECVVWTPFSKTMVVVTDILAVFAAVIGAIAGIAVLLTSMVRRQKLCRYPSIFVVYQTIPAIVLSVLVFIGVSARHKLFCRSRDLLQSFEKPTAFCFMSGIVFYYVVIQLLFWWLWHTIAVFWAIARPPFQMKNTSTQRKNRYIHVGLILAGLILPVLPILVVVFAGKEYRYGMSFTLTRSPPILCSGIELHTNFWGVIFPTSLMLGLGISLLVLILRTVIKKHIFSKFYGIKVISTWTLEFKILLILCYYVIFGAAVLTIFVHDLLNLKNKKNMILKYFKCESMGLLQFNDSSCFHTEQSIQTLFNPIPTSIATVILGFLPVVNLVYAIKFSVLKSKIKTYSQIRYMQYISKGRKRAGGNYPYTLNVNYDHKTSTLLCDSQTSIANTEILITPQGTLNRDHSYY